MIIKICGMKDPENIRIIAGLGPDIMGFVFYPPSPRYVGKEFSPEITTGLPCTIGKAGVFVNDSTDRMLQAREKFGLDYLQLHGEESVAVCRKLKKNGAKVIKAFQVGEGFEFRQLKVWHEHCSMFLFDSQSRGRGGSGHCFNWDLLCRYDLPVPFLLSGGIGSENIRKALRLTHPMFAGVDLNSRLEIMPGIKSVALTENIIHTIRDHEQHSSR